MNFQKLGSKRLSQKCVISLLANFDWLLCKPFLKLLKKAFAKNLIKIGTHRKCALYQELTRSNVGTTAMTILYYDNEMGFLGFLDPPLFPQPSN